MRKQGDASWRLHPPDPRGKCAVCGKPWTHRNHDLLVEGKGFHTFTESKDAPQPETREGER